MEILFGGLEQLGIAQGRWRRAHREIGDFRALHRVAGHSLVNWVDRNFEAEGALLREFSAGWPPLARATVAARRRRGLGLRPLQATGALRRGVALAVGGRQATVSDRVVYAARHQLGLGVPRRPIFPEPLQIREIILPGMIEHLEGGLP